MTALDCNILVQLAFADHPKYEVTAAAVERELRGGSTLVISSLVVAEFLHVTTDSKRFNPPLTMAEAADWVLDLLNIPTVRLIQPSEASTRQALAWMKQLRLGRKRVLDTQLAATLMTENVRRFLTSNAQDFKIFGCFDLISP